MRAATGTVASFQLDYIINLLCGSNNFVEFVLFSELILDFVQGVGRIQLFYLI